MLRVPLVLLAALEALAFLGAPAIGAWLLRGEWPHGFKTGGIVYAAILSLSLLSLGLYSRRQRARLSGVLLRAFAAVLAGSAVAGLIAFLLPMLSIERGVFTRGRSPFGYLEALNAHLFLSANEEDVRGALQAGFPVSAERRKAASASVISTNGATRLTSSMRRHTAGVAAFRSACGMRMASPALLTSTSSRPCRCTTEATRSWIAASSARSAWW